MSIRDPRVDPRPGDKTKAPDGYEYVITHVDGGHVTFEAQDDGYTDTYTIEFWRECAVKDEVIEVAP